MAVKFLERHMLNIQLDNIIHYPLTVVKAPMGYGKTTSIREYLRIHSLPSVFISLFGAGDPIAYFWERLTMEISKINGGYAEQLRQLGFPSDAPQAAKIVDMLKSASLTSPVIIIIDDYHLMDRSQSAELISLIASEEILNFHIVVITRETEYLTLDELLQKGLCLFIDQNDLKFRKNEIIDYFNLNNIPIDDTVADQIERETGGWISGIYLIARNMTRGYGNGYNNANINQLIETNMYTPYDLHVRSVLERFSFVCPCTSDQVCFVLDDPECAKILNKLSQRNSFVIYNGADDSYQMTELFRNFLQKKAKIDRMDPTELYRRTAYWLLDHDRHIEACDYLFRASDIHSILEILDKEDYRDVHFNDFKIIQEIFDTVPQEQLFQYPLAFLRYIRVEALTSDHSSLSKLNDQLSKMEHFYLSATIEEERRRRILGEIHNTWIIVSFNDVYSMIEHADKAVNYFDGNYSCLISNATEFTFGVPSIIYSYHTDPGKLKETVDFISATFHILAQAVKNNGAGSEHLVVAEYALECCHFEKVELEIYKALYQSRLYDQIDIEICCIFSLCRLKLHTGKWQEATELLEQLRKTVEQRNNSVYNTTMDICTAYLNCCIRHTENVPDWIKTNKQENGAFMYMNLGLHHVSSGYYVLLKKEYVQLLVLCDEYEKDWTKFRCQLGLLYCNIFRACSSYGLHDFDNAVKYLCVALDSAYPDGIILPFAEINSGIQELLKLPEIQNRYPEEYLTRLDDCCSRHANSISLINDTPKLLSERELQILDLLCQEKTHQEIGNELFISVATVRYHIKNLYRKLDVNNKTSAIKRAKDLNLI